MKKAFAILLIAISITCMCFALTACNDNGGGEIGGGNQGGGDKNEISLSPI